MRTTIRIDDDLMSELKQHAQLEKVSLTQFVNRLLRRGLATGRATRPTRPFRQKTFRMGAAAFDMNKAVAFASTLEDEEILRKLTLRK
jgi:hypothetical protein